MPGELLPTQYSQRKEVGILKGVAMATYATAALTVGGLEFAAYTPAIHAIRIEVSQADIDQAQHNVDAYVQGHLSGDCKDAVDATIARGINPLDIRSIIHHACFPSSEEAIFQNISRLRKPIDDANSINLFPIAGVTLANLAIAGGLLYARKKKGVSFKPQDLITVDITSKMLHSRHETIDQRQQEWANNNQNWLRLTSESDEKVKNYR